MRLPDSFSPLPTRLIAGAAVLAGTGLLIESPVLAQAGRIVAWGNVPPFMTPPPGQYTRLAIGGAHALALRPDGTMVAWGSNNYGQGTAQPGTFVDIAAGVDHCVALRSDGVAVSWGYNMWGEAITPPGTFVAISAGYRSSGGIRSDGTLFVWGLVAGEPVPEGPFQAISVGGGPTVAAIRTDGTMVSWEFSPPAIVGTFSAVKMSACLCGAIRTDGSAVTFGYCGPENYPPPPGQFVQLSSSSSGGLAALRTDGSIAVWGPHPASVLNVPPGRFSFVAMGPESGFAILPCYPNCDGSSVAPMLTANDFMCFLNRFASGHPYANCDGTASPALTANDFQCFLNQFAAGCS